RVSQPAARLQTRAPARSSNNGSCTSARLRFLICAYPCRKTGIHFSGTCVVAMIYVGLDGYRKGWVAVRVDGETRELCFYSTIAEFLMTKFDSAAIDMPIGLPDAGERACDLAARTMLKPHSSRIFTGARRGLWEFGAQAVA